MPADHLLKNKESIQNFKDTGASRFIFQNEIDIACFEHDMAYEDLRTFLEKDLLIKYFVIKHLIFLKM